MGKVTYNEANNASVNSNNNQEYPVKFFSLKNGEEAIVRILIDTVDDFDIRTVHSVKMDGWQYGRNVNCIMENGDSRTCPLCSRGDKLVQKLYIRLLKYTTSQDGKITVTPMIWERNRFDRAFGTQPLANHINVYGPLSDILCRIARSGEGLNTVYTPTFGLNIMPNTKAIYRDDLYVKDTSLFGDFDVLGVSILDKNYTELAQFVQTGAFPAKNPNDDAVARGANTYGDTAPTGTAQFASGVTVPSYSQVEDNNAPQHTYQGQPTQQMPWESNNSQFTRPRRY